jgi:hypothetical protein
MSIACVSSIISGGDAELIPPRAVAPLRYPKRLLHTYETKIPPQGITQYRLKLSDPDLSQIYPKENPLARQKHQKHSKW